MGAAGNKQPKKPKKHGASYMDSDSASVNTLAHKGSKIHSTAKKHA